MRILITGANGPAGMALGEQLRGSGHEVIGADMDNAPNEFYDLVEKVPAAIDPGMIPRLADLIHQHGVQVLLPTVSDELPAVAAAHEAGQLGCVVMIGAAAAVDTAHDKWLTVTRLISSGVPVPRSALPSHFASTQQAVDALGSPFILKPRVARGGRGVSLIDAADELDLAELDDSWLLQEFASGEEYAPMVFHAGPDSGTDFCAVVRKTELKQGKVGNAVDTVRIDGPEAEEVAALALDTVRALGLEFQADLDVRRLADGRAVVLEVNARFGANSRRAPQLLELVLQQAQALSGQPVGRG